MTPSSAQISFARDLGIPQNLIDGATKAELGKMLEVGKLARERQREKPATQTGSAAAQQTVDLSNPDSSQWRGMRTWYLHHRDRIGYAPAEAALLIVQDFDYGVKHRQCWPAEVLEALSDRTDESIRQEFSNERKEFLSHAERLLKASALKRVSRM
jgi:hypothetical protein